MSVSNALVWAVRIDREIGGGDWIVATNGEIRRVIRFGAYACPCSFPALIGASRWDEAMGLRIRDSQELDPLPGEDPESFAFEAWQVVAAADDLRKGNGEPAYPPELRVALLKAIGETKEDRP